MGLRQKLENEFADDGVDIIGNSSVLEKLSELCVTYSLEPEEIVTKWKSFAHKLRSPYDINVEILRDFEKKHLKKEVKPIAKKTNKTIWNNRNKTTAVKKNMKRTPDSNPSTLTLEGKLEKEFGDFGIDIEGNSVVLEKLSELCTLYSLDPEDMIAKWISFAYKLRSLQDINLETLMEFEKKQLTKETKMVVKKEFEHKQFTKEDKAVTNGKSKTSDRKVKTSTTSTVNLQKLFNFVDKDDNLFAPQNEMKVCPV